MKVLYLLKAEHYFRGNLEDYTVQKAILEQIIKVEIHIQIKNKL